MCSLSRACEHLQRRDAAASLLRSSKQLVWFQCEQHSSSVASASLLRDMSRHLDQADTAVTDDGPEAISDTLLLMCTHLGACQVWGHGCCLTRTSPGLQSLRSPSARDR